MAKKNELIHEYLTRIGWKYKGGCNCGGMPTSKYTLNTDAGEYRLKVRQSTYLLSRPGQKYYKDSNNELKRTVDEITLPKAQD